MSMPLPSDRRSRKRLAMRQGISNAATLLFFERGFDRVTMEEIADAADVSRMTVFNHFPRKEDLFFDRDEEGRGLLGEALRHREPDTDPIETLRLLLHRLSGDKARYLDFSEQGRAYVAAVEGSQTLKARARAIRDELAQVVTAALAEGAGRSPDDPDAHLAGGLLLATWTVAFIQAHRTFQQTQDAGAGRATFLAVVNKGTIGVRAAMAGTPFA